MINDCGGCLFCVRLSRLWLWHGILICVDSWFADLPYCPPWRGPSLGRMLGYASASARHLGTIASDRCTSRTASSQDCFARPPIRSAANVLAMIGVLEIDSVEGLY